jgi:hypothetical protein
MKDLALRLQELDFDLVHVDLSRKPNWYRNINPWSLVPAITYQGDTYTESADICRCVRDLHMKSCLLLQCAMAGACDSTAMHLAPSIAVLPGPGVSCFRLEKTCTTGRCK